MRESRFMGVPLNAFISYRSSDTRDMADQVAARLKADLGLAAVYYAPTDNRLFDDWSKNILGSLQTSQVVVALVGPNWTGGCDHLVEHHDCILDESDWVRREVAYGLSDPETVVLPVAVGIDRIPDRNLPIDVQAISTTQGIMLDAADLDELGYQQILTACWLSLAELDQNTMIVISDGSDEARVDLERLIAQLDEEGLADLARLSATVNAPGGLHAIPLREGAQRWPEIIAIVPRTKSEIVAARLTAAIRIRGAKTATTIGGTLALSSLGVTNTAADLGVNVVQSTSDKVLGAIKAGSRTGASAGRKLGIVVGSVGLAAAGIVGGVLATQPGDPRAGDCIYVTWMGATFQNITYEDYEEDGGDCIDGVGIYDAGCSLACFVTPQTCDDWYEDWAARYLENFGGDPAGAATDLSGEICGRQR